MRFLGGLVVVVVLLVRTQCEVRARDPGEDGGTGGEERGAAGGGEQQQEVLDDLLDGPETTLPPGPGSPRPPENHPTRTGNWCAFVQQRLVTSVVKCGTERYTIRTPCPAETPDCQLVMYQASSRPVYRQKQQVFTALQWRCCPGHSGSHCQDSDEQNDTQLLDPQFQPGNRDYGQPHLHHSSHQLHHSSHQLHHSNHGGSQEAQRPVLPSEAEQLVQAVAEQVLAQLNPVLEGFNRSLALLDRRVEELARDLAQRSPGPDGDEVQAPTGLSENRLEEALVRVEEVHQLLDSQRTAMEARLHSQHAMLHYNLTSFKTEVDVKLKRTWKMLQTNFQGLNASLVDLRTRQEQRAETSSTAIESNRCQEPACPIVQHLNTTTINTLLKVSSLEEDLKENGQLLGDLQRSFHRLEERISQTGRDSQVQFMETGLEVEAMREMVLKKLRELEGNVSLVVQQMQLRDADVDFLFTVVYNCTALRDRVEHLERGLANLTEPANEKRPAPELGARQGAGHREWEPLVKELQLSLQQVMESLAAEQGGGLKEEMRRLSSSFDSLLKDAIKHHNVLEILLDEDVLVFTRWTPLQQEAYSIPTLKEHIRSLKEDMERHNHRLAVLQRDKAESPMADQPLPAVGEAGRSSPARREQQLLVAGDPAGGGEGALKEDVAELGLRVQALEADGRGVQEEKLQEEVLWLRMAMQDHLRVFKEVFSGAETLEESHRTLNLQDLWTMTQDSRREGKRGGERRRGGKDGERRRGDKDGGLRSRRDSTASSPPGSQGRPLLLAGQRGGLLGVGGLLPFRASLNVGGVYSERTGRFTAPRAGHYLLLLTLDLRPGHAHLLLRRRRSGDTERLLQKEVTEDTGALSFLRLLHLVEEEELWVELREGELLESSSNALAVMLLH